MQNSSRYIQSRIIDRFSDSGRYFKGTYAKAGFEAIEKMRVQFPLRKAVDFTFYKPRTLQRYLLLKDRFGSYVDGDILDMGSRDDTVLKIFNKPCTLVDKNNPDLPPFDWEKENLPFADNSFDSVICLDTLEHINDIHNSFHDLMRVSRKYVLISVPNCWRKMTKIFMRGYGSGASYGLPPEKPFDRHKWFFNPEDVDNFTAYNGALAKNPFDVVDVAYHMPKTRLWHKIFYPILLWIAPVYFKNIFTETIFVVLKKR